MTSRCFHRREVTFLDTTGGWLNCAICHKSVDRLTGRIVPGGCRTVRPCTVAARITKTARTAGREPSPKWRSRLSDGKFSFSTARLGKTPGLGRWHAWGPGKTSSFDSRNFFCFFSRKTLDVQRFVFYCFSQRKLWKDPRVWVVENGSDFSASKPCGANR